MRLERAGPAEGYHIEVRGDTVRVSGERRPRRAVRHRTSAAGAADESRHDQHPDGWSETSAPQYPLRGHQLGYRPKTNSYDGWTVPVWEQYIRDLAVFGTNAIELIPPRSDDAADSPHFPLPPMHMMIEMSRLADEYGLDVWIWYPAMDRDYSDPKTVEFALEEWGEVFRQAAAHRCRVRARRRSRPHASPRSDGAARKGDRSAAPLSSQGADVGLAAKLQPGSGWTSFSAFCATEPAWLSGVVFGPQVRVSLPELRAAVPQRYPIRHYPDITHSRQCQYPVPDWDVAYAVTEGREVINPRPLERGRHLPAHRSVHHRLPHLFGRLQRRREQVRLERARLESGCEGRRHSARSTAATSSASAYGESFAARPAGAGAQLARPARDQHRRRHNACDISRQWSAPATPQMLRQLALPAGALSRLLRCLHARAPASTKRSSKSEAMDALAHSARNRR